MSARITSTIVTKRHAINALKLTIALVLSAANGAYATPTGALLYDDRSVQQLITASTACADGALRLVNGIFSHFKSNNTAIGSSLATNGRLIIDRDADSALNSLDAIGTPLGPVAAAIIVIFVILVAAVYAYRHQVRLELVIVYQKSNTFRSIASSVVVLDKHRVPRVCISLH